MSFRNLLQEFESIDELPIEIPEVESKVQEISGQDKIIISAMDGNQDQILGTFVQYTEATGVYSEPDFVTHITYNQDLSLDMQRLICCKELMHVFDSGFELTRSRDGIESLLERISKNSLSETASKLDTIADIAYAKDLYALYQAVAILFPNAARNKAIECLESGQKTIEDISDWALIPKRYAEIVVCDDWLELKETCELL